MNATTLPGRLSSKSRPQNEGSLNAEGPVQSPTTGPFARALLVAATGVVVYGALLVAVDGVLSLVLDLDVVTEPDAGPLIGPVMALVALAFVFIAILNAQKATRSQARLPLAAAILGAIAVYLASPLAGAVLYRWDKRGLTEGFSFFTEYLSSPFVIASAVLALIVILIVPPVAALGSSTKRQKTI